MHDIGFDHEHEHGLTDAERLEIAAAIWEQETVDLLTVGFDIGSSTTHLLFARVVLRREQHDLSSRFVPVERRIVWRSPIILTPFLADGRIDAEALRRFKDRCYEDAGYAPDDVDSGAVILTGEAIKRHNARAIDELFAAEAGRFVCATAGHRLESMLAAQGSGAAALSAKRKQCILHVDIGGGTTKLAIIEDGAIKDVAAFAVGGRLLAQDEAGNWTRIDEAARIVARSLGLEPTPEIIGDDGNRARIVERMADIVLDQITGMKLDPLGQALLLTEPLERTAEPACVTFSGGVAEYLFRYEDHSFGDIAQALAEAIARRMKERLKLTVIDPGQRIRATVIGASQFTVQVSGNTVHIDDPTLLPLRNVPVLHMPQIPSSIDPRLVAEQFKHRAGLQDVDLKQVVALSFSWPWPPDYESLRAICSALLLLVEHPMSRRHPLVIVTDADVALTLGRIIKQDLQFDGKIFCIDGVQLQNLDFIDLGTMIEPASVVPIVIKSLLFS